VLVASIRRSPFGEINQPLPDAVDLAQGPLAKVVVSRFQHHFCTISQIDNIFRKTDGIVFSDATFISCQKL